MLGLRPLGPLSFRLARPFLGTGVIAALWVSLRTPPESPPVFAFIGAATVLGVVMFFLPLYDVHRRMLRERGTALASVRGELFRLVGMRGGPGPDTSEERLTEVMNLLRRLMDMSTLDVAERRIAALPTWPFGTRILRRLAALTLTIITVLVSRFIATQFGL